MKWFKSKLTMKRGQCLFVDMVDGNEVFEYVDCFGQHWMANFNHWFYRIKR